MSFPPGTEMFQFPGFASLPYEFRQQYRRSGGLPHSEIHGSKLVRSSPWLIAAYHVLHRLCAPRHSPDALKSLDCSHYQCPSEDDLDSDQLVYINVRLATDSDVKTRFSSRSTRQRKRLASLTEVSGILHKNLRPCGYEEASGRSPLHDVKEVRPSGIRRRRNFGSWQERARSFRPTARRAARGQMRSSRSQAGITKLVEPDGIEPTTSCLQSRRSPN